MASSRSKLRAAVRILVKARERPRRRCAQSFLGTEAPGITRERQRPFRYQAGQSSTKSLRNSHYLVNCDGSLSL
jgi:hypothetical protein